MKRDLNNLDFRNAFTPIPAECRQALLDAARSVKEEKQVKRASFRAMLIAAILMPASSLTVLTLSLKARTFARVRSRP